MLHFAVFLHLESEKSLTYKCQRKPIENRCCFQEGIEDSTHKPVTWGARLRRNVLYLL